MLATLLMTMLTASSFIHSGPDKTFGEDVSFLSSHVKAIVLESADGKAKVVVVPAYQGRVMTSTAGGDAGASFGYINYELIASGKTVPKINVFGGEDRFWVGPEGGQFGLYFAPGKTFTFDDWQTPAAIDTDAYTVASQSKTHATFAHKATFVNNSGTTFNVTIDRTVRLLDPGQAAKEVGFDLGEAKAVAYQSENTITNAGTNAWTKESGLLSVWILSMYKPSPKGTVCIPFVPSTDAELGPAVNDSYFGAIPASRLKIDREKSVVYFKADGQQRGKLGIPPRRVKPVCGSYDGVSGVLTIVWFNLPKDAASLPYVNSAWEQQKNPFGGDVVNSYNDGATTPGGKPLGPFFELETSSPAAPLAPAKSMQHTHRTLHLQGDRKELDRIAKAALGVGLDEIEKAVP